MSLFQTAWFAGDIKNWKYKIGNNASRKKPN